MEKRRGRTRTASERDEQTEKETMTDKEGEREIRQSVQTLGLEPRREAKKREATKRGWP
jgi:hypothetical protein